MLNFVQLPLLFVSLSNQSKELKISSTKSTFRVSVELILLAPTVYNFVQNKVEALGHQKKLLTRLSHRGHIDSGTILYHVLILMAELWWSLQS